jgi:hypothetical protein
LGNPRCRLEGWAITPGSNLWFYLRVFEENQHLAQKGEGIMDLLA